MSNEAKKQDQLEKLARMRSSGMANVDIASASGLSESRISQIFSSDEFLAVQECVEAERFEQQELINNGWDSVEALGVNKVIEALSADPDSDFALRAAVMANKASRRGNYKNNPIAQSAGLKAVIVLNNNFVQHLQNMTEIIGEGKKVSALSKTQKAINFLPPGEVQELLGVNSSAEMDRQKQQQIDAELPEFTTLAPEAG